MNEINLTELQSMLDNALRPISDNLSRVNDTLVKLEAQQKETSEDIHKSVMETELVKQQVQFVEENQKKSAELAEKEMEEFKKSLAKNWDHTRDLTAKFKIISGIGVIALGIYELVKGIL